MAGWVVRLMGHAWTTGVLMRFWCSEFVVVTRSAPTLIEVATILISTDCSLQTLH